MNKYLKVYVLILLKKDFIHEQKTLNSFQFLVVACLWIYKNDVIIGLAYVHSLTCILDT